MTVQLALRVVSLESRRSEDMARLLVRHGMLPIHAPSMLEVPLDDQTDAFAFGDALLSGKCDVLVLLTGVGARVLIDAISTRWPSPDVLAALAGVQIVCRGPKPVAILKGLGLKASLIAPEPNTSHELLAAMAGMDLRTKHVWVQEYGRTNAELLSELSARGANVHRAAVYAWRLPDDTKPLEQAIVALCDAQADAILFTSARQIDHLLEVAERMQRRKALLEALRTEVLLVSIGPVTSEALREHGLHADLEPEHSKMGHMAKLLAAEGLRALEQKREPARK